MYIELHARSAFSFLEGASLPEELIAVCGQLGMPAMALLDTDGVYGAPRFHLAAQKAKLKAHIGATRMLGLDHQRADIGTIEPGADSGIFGRQWRGRIQGPESAPGSIVPM